MWRNDTKCKCMFMFPLKNLARKELTISQHCWTIKWCIDGSVQKFSNSIADALELLQSCTKPSIWSWFNDTVIMIWWNRSCKVWKSSDMHHHAQWIDNVFCFWKIGNYYYHYHYFFSRDLQHQIHDEGSPQQRKGHLSCGHITRRHHGKYGIYASEARQWSAELSLVHCYPKPQLLRIQTFYLLWWRQSRLHDHFPDVWWWSRQV